jgi:predicted dehydrogenase
MVDASDKPPATAASPLRVGVIGLGPRWQKRYRPALLALRERFQISALCDQVQERAVLESRRLGGTAVAGPVEMVERHDTDAVLLIDPQWYRLWPLEAACRRGKPVFCADSLERDDAHADALCRQVRDARLPVMMALAHRYTPAAMQVQEILDQRGARPRLVICAVTQPPGRPAGLSPGAVALLDWCATLLQGTPTHVLAAGLANGELTTHVLRYEDGRAIQINHYGAPGLRRSVSLRVITDRGTAVVRPRHRVCWSDAAGQLLVPRKKQPPREQLLLEQFHAAVSAGRPPVPDLAHAHRLLAWWRLALRSYQESLWIEVPGKQD